MLPVHALVSLADAKKALRIRATDTQNDELIEGIIEEATGFVESATGRQIIWRARATDSIVASGAVVDGPLAVTNPVTAVPFMLSYEWTSGPGSVSAKVLTSGLYGGVVVSEEIALPARTQVNGRQLFDSITSMEIDDTSGDDGATIRVVAAMPFVEKHVSEGQKHLYVVHRPIIQLVKAEDGDYSAGETGWLTLPESMFFVNTSLGKLSRVSKTRAFVDFPEDYYFRYPQRAETGFGPWAPDARITYFGGYLSHESIPSSLKTWALLAVTGIYRERERKDSDLQSESNSIGSQTKADWREMVTKGLADERRMTGSGEGIPS